MAVLTTLFVSTFVLTEEFPLFLGIALLILVLYVIYKLVSADAVDEEEFINEDSGNLLIRGPLSLIATIYGSQLVVNNAIELAELFGVSSLIIGSTIIAIGTSLPEVAGTISAAKMRKPDIVFGNIFGSNLFNIGLVGGVAISISPGGILTDVDYQIFLMYFVSFLVIFLSRNLIKRNNILGYAFTVFYILFLISLF